MEDKRKGSNSTICKNVERGRYIKTLLLCYFLGVFGAHRIINKKPSGKVILTLATFSISIYVIITLKYDSLIKIGDIAFVMLIDVLYILSIFTFIILYVWQTIDVILIMIGKFRVENGNTYIKSGEKFFSVWANNLVLVLFIISLIFMGMSYSRIFSFEEGKSYEVDNKSLSKLGNCIKTDVPTEFKDTINLKKWLEKNNYNVVDDPVVLDAMREFKTVGLQNQITVVKDVSKESKYLCEMTLTYNITNDSSKDSNLIIIMYDKTTQDRLYISNHYYDNEEDRNIIISGYYYIKTDYLELFYQDGENNYNLNMDNIYDIELDSLNIVEDSTVAVETFVRELHKFE